MYDIKGVGERLKELRSKRANLYNENPNNKRFIIYACCKTQESLSEAIGKERRTIGNWENGKSLPDIESLIKLCNILNCSIDYFLGVTDISEIDPVIMASHHTGISSDIIGRCMRDSHYLDFLNFVMKPENCEKLVRKFELIACGEYLNNDQLSNSNIKSSKINELNDYFEEFCCFTSPDKNNLEGYKEYLKTKLPKVKNNKRFNIKSYINPKIYDKVLFSENFNENYDNFISYLAEQTYEPFKQTVIIKFQKENMLKCFLSIFEKYVLEFTE